MTLDLLLLQLLCPAFGVIGMHHHTKLRILLIMTTSNFFRLYITCFISLFNCMIPVRSVFVAPTAPISWMEIAGLTFESMGRTVQNERLKKNLSNFLCHVKKTYMCIFLFFCNFYFFKSKFLFIYLLNLKNPSATLLFQCSSWTSIISTTGPISGLLIQNLHFRNTSCLRNIIF